MTYPVNDQTSVYDAVNYLLSGPGGLGQNFQGFSAYKPAYLTGSFRQPWEIWTTATTTPPLLYVPPISINNIVSLNVVDGKTANIEWTFTTPQVTPPFTQGQTVYARGIDPSYYNSYYYVLTCNTTTFITQDLKAYPYPSYPYVSGGEVYVDQSNAVISNDANARVSVAGPTDIVFISSQLGLDFDYTCSTTSSFEISVQIERDIGGVDTENPGAIDYLFSFDKIVSEQVYPFTISTSTTATISDTIGQAIFTTILDQPSFGYYWYLAVAEFRTQGLTTVPGALWFSGLDITSGVTSASTSSVFNNVPVNTITGSGIGAVSTATLYGAANAPYSLDNTSLTFPVKGSGYQVGDQVSLLGTDLGGTSPTNDLILTVTSTADPGDAKPYTMTVGIRSLTAQVIKQ
jgi:hypothetical protein